LGRGAGSDFDTQIFVKSEAPRLLRAALSKERWIGERIVFSGVTDPYQPVEASLGLTRGCLEVCEEASNPVTIITKGALVERDVELLASIHRRSDALVVVSLPFLNGEVARKIEPGVPSPRRRLAVIERLSSAGIPVSVAISPIIPGLNDMEIPGILRAARRAGARFAHHSLVRLQGNVERVFRQRLHESFPKRKERVLHQIASCRNGERETREFHSRMKGRGERWKIVTALFAQTKRRLAFEEWKGPMQSSAFRRPRMDGQLSLF
jgi:DNA repair photolyase